MKESPKPSEIILMVSGLLFFVFTFFSWVTVEATDEVCEFQREQLEDAEDGDAPDDVIEDYEDDLADCEDEAGGGGWNAWGSSPEDSDSYTGLFPIVTIAGLLALGTAVVVALRIFTSTSVPETMVGFTWPQLHLATAVFAALVTISFVILDKSFGLSDEFEDAGASIGAGLGLWLGLLAAAGLVVGAVMTQKEEGPAPASGPSAPPQQF